MYKSLLITGAMMLPMISFAIDVQRDDIVINTTPANFQADIGDTVTFEISLVRAGEPVVDQRMQYELSWDTFEVIESQTFRTTSQPFSVTTTADRIGFIRIWVFSEGLRNVRNQRNEAGVAVVPTEIEPGQIMPEDFDEFWESKRQLVYETPMFPQLEPVPNQVPNFETFDLKLNAPGGLDCSGYYGRPTNAAPGTLPAILYVHAAGVYSSWLSASATQGAAFNAIVLDLNSHGIPNGREWAYYSALSNGALSRYWLRGSSNREESYYLGIYMRMMRALQFLKSQPEWDGKTLIVCGESEGGGLSTVAAGLDPDVTLFVAQIPALCDQMGFLRNQPMSHPFVLFNGFAPQGPVTTYNTAIATTSGYFDAVNFARKTQASAVVTVGFIDTTVSPTSVYAMFNSLQTEDKIAIHFPDLGHGFPTKVPNTREMLDNHILRFIRDGHLK